MEPYTFTRLDELREVLNMSTATDAAIAAASGVAHNTVKAIRRGTANPTVGTIEAIAEAVARQSLDGVSCKTCKHLGHWEDEPRPSGFCELYMIIKGPHGMVSTTGCVLHTPDAS